MAPRSSSKKRKKRRRGGGLPTDSLGWRKVEIDREKFGMMGENFEGMLSLEEIDAKDFFPSRRRSDSKPEKSDDVGGAETTTSATTKGSEVSDKIAAENKTRKKNNKRKKRDKSALPTSATTTTATKKETTRKNDDDSMAEDGRTASRDEDLFEIIATARDGGETLQKGGDGATQEPSTKRRKKKQRKNRTDKKGSSSSSSSKNGTTTHTGKKTNDDHTENKHPNATTVRSKKAGVASKEWLSLKLHPQIAGGLCALGFTKPTPIQSECIPLAGAGGKDIIAAAPTGSGKTLAFALPILHRILRVMESRQEDASGGQDRPLSALILAPTRDLAMQIHNVFRQVLEHIGSVGSSSSSNNNSRIICEVIVGGMAIPKQQRLLRKRPHIVIGTPGRLWELMRDGNEHLSMLSKLKILVLDEADRMLERGHFAELRSILDVIKSETRVGGGAEGATSPDQSRKERRRKAKKQRFCTVQTLLFSATMTIDASGRENLSRRERAKGKNASFNAQVVLQQLQQRMPFRRPPVLVDLSKTTVAKKGGGGKSSHSSLAEGILDYVIECIEKDKDIYLYYFLKLRPGKTVVFVNSIACLRRIVAILAILELKVYPLHAKMQQRQRLKYLDRFRKDPSGVLIASDVAARGLDVADINYIVNYQLPRSAEVYIHRCGRTGRAGAKGMSLSLVGPNDQISYTKICKVMGRIGDIPRYPVDPKFLRAIRDRVSLAIQIDKVESKTKRKKSKNDWFRKNAALMDIDLDEELLEDETGGREEQREAAKAAQLRQSLARLLAKPIVARGVSHKFFSLNKMKTKADGSLDMTALRRAV